MLSNAVLVCDIVLKFTIVNQTCPYNINSHKRKFALKKDICLKREKRSSL